MTFVVLNVTFHSSLRTILEFLELKEIPFVPESLSDFNRWTEAFTARQTGKWPVSADEVKDFDNINTAESMGSVIRCISAGSIHNGMERWLEVQQHEACPRRALSTLQATYHHLGFNGFMVAAQEGQDAFMLKLKDSLDKIKSLGCSNSSKEISSSQQ
jgi:hypothetical protein